MRITTTTGSVYRPSYMSRELSIGELSTPELHKWLGELEGLTDQLSRLTRDDIECELEDRELSRREGW